MDKYTELKSAPLQNIRFVNDIISKNNDTSDDIIFDNHEDISIGENIIIDFSKED